MLAAVEGLPTDDDCSCRTSLAGQRLPFELP